MLSPIRSGWACKSQGTALEQPFDRASGGGSGGWHQSCQNSLERIYIKRYQLSITQQLHTSTRRHACAGGHPACGAGTGWPHWMAAPDAPPDGRVRSHDEGRGGQGPEWAHVRTLSRHRHSASALRPQASSRKKTPAPCGYRGFVGRLTAPGAPGAQASLGCA